MRVQSLLPLVSLYLATRPAFAAPTNRKQPRLASGVSVVLFDAPALLNADGSVTASAQAFTFQGAKLDTSKLSDALSPILAPLVLFGIDADEALDRAIDRTRLLVADPEPAQAVTIDVKGCANPLEISETDEVGLALQTVNLGKCGSGGSFLGELSGTSAGAGADSSMTVFPSPDAGFGVISDIDDTVKISNVLNKLKLAKATLFDEAEPVPGMPSLYASLQKSLDNPSFTYITGSPYQLGPFLRQFIKDEFASTPGPVLGKNLTLSLDRIGELADFLFDGENTKEFKLGQIQRVRNIWPSKKFLLVGDSGEKDSETYGEAFRTHGPDAIACIWIRKVDGADNSAARFAAAFKGVPAERIRTYSDKDILDVLPKVDIKGGKC